MKEKIKEIFRTKKKYLILAAVYILCVILSAAADPWAWDTSSFDGGFTFEISSAQDVFLDGYSWDMPYDMQDGSLRSKMLLRLLSFGADDIYSYHYCFPSDNFKEVLRVTFPLMMILKLTVSKRLFKKEKDKVELEKPKFRFLYYHTENILAEVAADDITFYLIGVVTKLVSLAFGAIAVNAGGGLRWLSNFMYSLLLIVTLPIYKASEFLYDIYSDSVGRFYIRNELAYAFIIIPLMSLALAVCFDIVLRVMMGLYEIVFRAVKELFTKLPKFIDRHISDNYIRQQGGQNHENT